MHLILILHVELTYHLYQRRIVKAKHRFRGGLVCIDVLSKYAVYCRTGTQTSCLKLNIKDKIKNVVLPRSQRHEVHKTLYTGFFCMFVKNISRPTPALYWYIYIYIWHTWYSNIYIHKWGIQLSYKEPTWLKTEDSRQILSYDDF